jgi:serine/threonine protein kinase
LRPYGGHCSHQNRGQYGKEKFKLPTGETVEYDFDELLTPPGNMMDMMVVTASLSVCETPPCPKNYVLKYIKNCLSSQRCRATNSCTLYDTDSLIMDYVFGRVVNQRGGKGITPNVLALSEKFKWKLHDSSYSGDIPVGDGVTRTAPDFLKYLKVYFDVPECSDSFARVIVEERAGLSLVKLTVALEETDDIKSGTDKSAHRIRWATTIFIKGLRLLEKIHSIGIIHGDIKVDNFALASHETKIDAVILGGEFDLVLIDFGKASFIMDDLVAAIKEPSDLSSQGLNAVFLSPWHIEGYARHFRDDIYRVFALYVEFVSQGLLSGIPWMEGPEGKRFEGKQQIARIMRNFNFVRGFDQKSFDYSSMKGPVDQKPLEEMLEGFFKPQKVDEAVLKQMEEIQTIARSRFPDTKRMITAAEKVLKVLSEQKRV